MTKNIGTIDKGLRIIVGLALITYGIITESFIGIVGIIPLGTALIGLCPIYSILGISSCTIKEDKKK